MATSRQSSWYLDLHEPQAEKLMLRTARRRRSINWSKSMPTHQYITMAEEGENAILPRSTNTRPAHLRYFGHCGIALHAPRNAAPFALAVLSVQGLTAVEA
jgi:hypothetical protein